MIGAFLDGWLTGDPELDEYMSRVAWPGWAEVTSVVGLAARLYLGGAGAPRRYFAWGQAVRRAVLTCCWCTRCWPLTFWCSWSGAVVWSAGCPRPRGAW